MLPHRNLDYSEREEVMAKVARKRASLNSVEALEDWPGIVCICLEVLFRRAPETAQIRNLAVEKLISIIKRAYSVGRV